MVEESWKLKLDGNSHMVFLDHDTWRGRRTIRVDGRLLPEPVAPVRGKDSQDTFHIDGHSCVLSIRVQDRRFVYVLEVDGVPVQPEQSESEIAAELSETAKSMWLLALFFLLIGLGAGWYNWYQAHTWGVFSRMLAFLAPLIIVFAVYVFLFPKDFLKQTKGQLSPISWGVAVVMLLVGFGHVYFFENIGY